MDAQWTAAVQVVIFFGIGGRCFSKSVQKECCNGQGETVMVASDQSAGAVRHCLDWTGT